MLPVIWPAHCYRQPPGWLDRRVSGLPGDIPHRILDTLPVGAADLPGEHRKWLGA